MAAFAAHDIITSKSNTTTYNPVKDLIEDPIKVPI